MMSRSIEQARREAYVKGKALYENKLREIVETPENIGKIISIEPETGDYAIADDSIASASIVLGRHPGAPMYAARIGYNAVYAVGGTLNRTADE